MKTVYVPIPSYPWPRVLSPFVEFPEEEKWLSEDYNFLDEETINRYRKQRLYDFVFNMWPVTNNPKMMRPILRCGYYHTIMDDYVGIMPLDELKAFTDRTYEVMMEQDPQPNEIGIFHQMAAARKEWIANGMPLFWIERMAREFREYFTYGVMEETPFKLSNTYPSVGRYLLIRMYSIGQKVFVNLTEAAMGQALPVHIHEHPVMNRLRELQSMIIAIQNDFASIRKELATDNETLNIILVVMHEYKTSLQEAIVESLRIHDEMVREIDSITSCLPDFGFYQKMVEDYIYHVKIMIHGLNAFYYESGTKRYTQEGFAIPKYGTANEQSLDLEIKHIEHEYWLKNLKNNNKVTEVNKHLK
ncbi:hypothetical protein ATE47_04270 [Chryseobacterium sp. IHB B 17019]|uniref:terpene synthase family protein n=1 Tax=Chryseobacterium sp. IHB B 17019 TaxID=1721091 RepID=UPI00071F91F8|nr:terpene synthase family protein [Chryseobacterium sp. IHB B 17019]ALR29785.1 hypothetical protein ATE47_04270 [Chryseobacterium sp. IHB B 17019]